MKIFLIAAILLLSACQTLGIEGDEELQVDEEGIASDSSIYNEAQDLLEKKDYKKAAERFLEVERQHPYSKWAAKSQIQAAYSYYKDEEYKDAIGTLERFVKLNPGNEQVDYAYYLIALSYYNQISSVERDQKMTLLAQQALRDVAARFPDSTYARDAKFKLDLVEDHLAGKEMAVGRYYLESREYIGAINRFKKVVEEYSTTAQVEEALHRLVESYLALGIVPEAQKYAAVLGHNYPGSEWYQDSYDLLIEGEIKSHSEGEESWYEVW